MNSDLFRNEAHTIKGSSANIGAEGMRKIAYELEQIGATGQLDTAPDLIISFKDEFGKVNDYFRNYMDNL